MRDYTNTKYILEMNREQYLAIFDLLDKAIYDNKATSKEQELAREMIHQIRLTDSPRESAPKKESIDTQKYLEAYECVVKELKDGLSYNQILKKEYFVKDLRTGRQEKKRISKTTLQNINRVLKNL